ncbi:SLAP domain-containing protein [Lactobacillus sp. LL6]|uniref:SLAP domain-containing protein n=1 Tax=Lactobacillus sp. LL6 TaxID=2596827 RepID=UPI001F5BA13D|nr:SLAP domain-containing protein [Lactobacillus sp. LL6]
MKKNVRMISAAAAALLAVAPVATNTIATNSNIVNAASSKKATKVTPKANVTITAGTQTVNIKSSVKPSEINKDWVQKNISSSTGNIISVNDVKADETIGNSFEGGKNYKYTANVAIGGLDSSKNTYQDASGKTLSVSNNIITSVPITFTIHVYDSSNTSVPFFSYNGQKVTGGVVPITNPVQIKKGETPADILNTAKSGLTVYNQEGQSSTGDISTTASQVQDQLTKQGVTFKDGKVENIPSSFLNITLTGTSSINGNTVQVTVPFAGSTTVTSGEPKINITENGAATTKTIFQVAAGSNFNPLDFTTSNGDSVKFSAQQSNTNTQAASLAATSNPVNTSEEGRFYNVTLTATNSNNKTSKLTYTILVVSNGQQEVYTNAETYNMYGNNPVATGSTINAGTKVYVSDDTRTINNVSYSKISTQSKTDANNGNTWIKTSTLVKPQVTEKTETKTVMVESRAYDKDGNYLNHNFETYSDIDIVPTVVTIKGKTYYKVGDKYKVDGKDTYVRVTNITGTKRTLKHNAYIYWSSYRRTPGTTKYYKGQTITTYGASYKFKNGKRYYRIEGCRDNNKRYIKTVNFY